MTFAGRVKVLVRRAGRGVAAPTAGAGGYDGYAKYDAGVAASYERTREAERHWEREDAFVGGYLERRRPRTLLDAPVGTARFVRHYARVRCAVGVDVSAAMLAEARRKLAGETPGVALSLVRGDVLSLPFPDRAFEVLVVFRLLHLLPEAALEPAVAEICRVTDAEAVVQTYVPARGAAAAGRLVWLPRSARSAARALRRFLSARRVPPTPWSHIRAYFHEQAAVDARFAACGLLPAESETVDEYGETDVRVTVYSRGRAAGPGDQC